METVVHFGIDVDDKSFHATGLSSDGEKIQFNCRPNASSLAAKLGLVSKNGSIIKCCYEAGYLGYSLYWEMLELGIDIVVISPASLPKSRDEQVKTDRIDSERLAKYYQLGLLSIVQVPKPENEIARDLTRTREFLLRQRHALRLHINSTCRRQGWNFKQETSLKTKWTTTHMSWLQLKIKTLTNADLVFNLTQLIFRLEQMSEQLDRYNDRIAEVAKRQDYAEQVRALQCYRGIDTLSALSLVTEIGDIKRFNHPRSFMSFIGLDVREYSSGGVQKQQGITKLGNKRIRTTLIESSQTCYKRPRISWALKRRRQECSDQQIHTANKCMNRLHKKSSRMLLAGKNVNKVKVACARELAGFIWSSLIEVQSASAMKPVSTSISAN